MKQILPLFLLLMLMPLCVLAQNNARPHGNNAQQQGSKFNFEQFLENKCNYVVGELGLTAEESARFVPVYQELQKEKSKLYFKYGNRRNVIRALDNGEQVADTAVMRIVRNNAQLQVEDAQLEQKYVEKFAHILTPVQLFKLQRAQQKFRTDVMKGGNRPRK